MNTKDITLEDIRLSVLVYGASGTGKTHFIGTFPKPYIHDFDDGALTLRGMDIEYDVYHDVSKNGVLQKSGYGACLLHLSELEEECPYETVAIDSISTLQESMLAQILKDNGRSEPTLHEWGLLIKKMREFFLRLRALGANKKVHVVVTAHEQVVKDELIGNVLVLPMIVGKKMPGQLPLFFDEVYRLEVSRGKEGKPEYQMLTRAETRFSAKSRLGVLETKEVPDFSVIMEKVGLDNGGGSENGEGT